MKSYPKWIEDKIQSWYLEDASLVYFRMDQDGKILESGGLFEKFHIQPPSLEADIRETFIFMEGLLPLDRSPVDLFMVKVQSEKPVDVHLFAFEKGYALIVADATQAEEQQRRIQQERNALHLSRRFGADKNGNH